MQVRLGQGCWSRGLGRLLPSGEAAGVGLGEDVEPDEAFQLGAGAIDVLRQRFVVEGFVDITGPEGAGDLVEDGEDAGGSPGARAGRARRSGLGDGQREQ
ncbi:hypothetical protein AQJ58_35180 [Streptomyces sp. DSM 15324]|nr:hypothetical protein AQJ58_35180 [Streptomyces sp. DSM 15324]